jgi:hypothetical protein
VAHTKTPVTFNNTSRAVPNKTFARAVTSVKQEVTKLKDASVTLTRQAQTAATPAEKAVFKQQANEAADSADRIADLVATTEKLRRELNAIANAFPTSGANYHQEFQKLRDRARKAVR